MLNTLTYVKAYPELHHAVLYLNDKQTDYEMMARLLDAGAEVAHVTELTESAVSDIDPFVIFLKNTSPRNVKGNPEWLRRWPLVYSHHSYVWPTIKCDWRIFNSHYLGNLYANKLDKMQSDFRYIGSLLDTAPFAAIKRPAARERCVIGRVSSDSAEKFPDEALAILKRVEAKVDADFFVVGASKYWTSIPKWLKTPGVGSRPVEEFYRDMDILIYRTDDKCVETWCRVITEALAAGVVVIAEKKGGIVEQINHGVDGFLCSTDDEFVGHAVALCNSPERRHAVGMAARAKAVREFDMSTLRQRTTDIVLRALTLM